MKLKNTLGFAIGSLIAATSFGALAQGQGAVEIEGFAKKEMFDSARDFKNNGNLFGGSVGYFLTDDVELRLAYDEVHNARTEDGTNVKGANTALDKLSEAEGHYKRAIAAETSRQKPQRSSSTPHEHWYPGRARYGVPASSPTLATSGWRAS